MAPSHGSIAVFKLGDGANALQDLSTYLTDAGLNTAIDMAEVSHLGDVAKEFVAGLSDGQIPLAGLVQATVDAQLQAILRVSGRLFEYYPFGNTGTVNTNVKYSGAGLVSSYQIHTPVGGASTFSANFQVSAAVTRALV